MLFLASPSFISGCLPSCLASYIPLIHTKRVLETEKLLSWAEDLLGRGRHITYGLHTFFERAVGGWSAYLLHFVRDVLANV